MVTQETVFPVQVGGMRHMYLKQYLETLPPVFLPRPPPFFFAHWLFLLSPLTNSLVQASKWIVPVSNWIIIYSCFQKGCPTEV